MAPDFAAAQVHDLEALAHSRFGKLTEAEVKLLRAAPTGEVAICGPNTNSSDPANDPGKSDNWGKGREIGAALIRWLCVDHEAKKRVDPKGIRAFGARVIGTLDLSFVTVPFRLELRNCRLVQDADLRNVEIPAINLGGTWVRSVGADGAKVKGDLFFRYGFRAEGAVRLPGAQIEGQLSCTGGTFENPPSKGMDAYTAALSAEGAVVKGGVFLSNGFHATGAVRLLNTEIGGDLNCNKGTFTNPAKVGIKASGNALQAERAFVKGSVFLQNGFFDGIVGLLDAEIGGSLECDNSRFINPVQQDMGPKVGALNAERILVKGSVFLRGGFHVEGAVRLLNAQIGGDLDCERGAFMNPPKPGIDASGVALTAERAVIKGSVFLRNGFRAEGRILLLDAQVVGNLECERGAFIGQLNARGAVVKGTLFWTNIIDPKSVALNLSNASVSSLQDDAASWPSPGNLVLDGFVYGRFSGGPSIAEDRLRWLARVASFTPQPYRQLAKVLRDEGDDDGAREVLVELSRKESGTSWAGQALQLPWRAMGYGYHPLRALVGLAVLSGLGWILYRRAYLARAVTPVEKEAYQEFKKTGSPPSHYRRFSPFIYSVENSLPLVKLGQVDFWQPEPNIPTTLRHGNWAFRLGRFLGSLRNAGEWKTRFTRYTMSPLFLHRFLWAQILLGWILATLFVAGVTGLVH